MTGGLGLGVEMDLEVDAVKHTDEERGEKEKERPAQETVTVPTREEQARSTGELGAVVRRGRGDAAGLL